MKYEFQKIVGSPIKRQKAISKLILLAKKEIAEWQEFIRVAELELKEINGK
jgi:hypothetical protein